VSKEEPELKGIDLARAALIQAKAQQRARRDDRVDRRDAKQGLRRTGARPDDRDPQSLRHIMGRLMAERGWEAPAAVHGVIENWDRLMGPSIAPYATPVTFEEGILTVRAESDAYATHVRYLASTMLKAFARELGDGVVKQIKVTGPASPGRRYRTTG
jgi:predicted nucleic acid-binding Zn ribbon protein